MENSSFPTHNNQRLLVSTYGTGAMFPPHPFSKINLFSCMNEWTNKFRSSFVCQYCGLMAPNWGKHFLWEKLKLKLKLLRTALTARHQFTRSIPDDTQPHSSHFFAIIKKLPIFVVPSAYIAIVVPCSGSSWRSTCSKVCYFSCFRFCSHININRKSNERSGLVEIQ